MARRPGAGEQKLQLNEDTARARQGTTAGDPTAPVAEQRDRTRSAQPDRSRGKGRGKGGKDHPRGPQTHTTSNPASTDHAETRHDLMAMVQNPNFPSTLTDDYLSQIMSGHKRHGEVAFKTWLHPGGRHESSGPPVRVAFRAYAANSRDKVPTELKCYRKHVAIQWTADGAREWRENDEPAHQWTYFGDRWDSCPRHMLVFLVPPWWKRFLRGWSASKVMKNGTGKMFEDSSRNLSTHDALLMQALGLPSVTIPGDPPTIFVLANSEFQPGSLERTGTRVMVRHPGAR